MSYQLMADSTTPWNIPTTIKYALVYANGRYKWADDQVDRFTGHVNIGVYGDAPDQATSCRELDVERYDAKPSDAPEFIQYRTTLGHDDATIYCNRETMPIVFDRCRKAGVHVPRWHIATLDGTLNVAVPEGILWAVQAWSEKTYDLSAVFGPYDFSTG